MLTFKYFFILVVFSGVLVSVNFSSLASEPVYIEKQADFSVDGNGIVYQGKLYFSGQDDIHGTELWVYNKRDEQPQLVVDLIEGKGSLAPRKFIVYKEKLYFEGNNGYLYSFNGLTNQITLIKDSAGINVRIINSPRLIVFNGKLYFFAYGGFFSLDGDTNTVVRAAYFDRHNCQLMSCDVVAYAGKLFFVSKIQNSSNGSGFGDLELFSFDSKTNTGSLVAEIRPGASGSSIQKLIVFRNKLYFAANDGVHGLELWVHDDKTGETSMVADINPGSSSGLAVFMQPWHGIHRNIRWESIFYSKK